MKFKIRFADQIVGAFIIMAAGALIFVIILLGSNQRWFARDYYFKTYFDSAAGLSKNMAVTFKGFTIGRVNRFDLTEDDRVEVTFYIFDTYISRVNQGSLVNLNVSPVGLGNQFIFYAGLGKTPLAEGDIIPAVHSPEGQALLARGLAQVPENGDSIGKIVDQLGAVLAEVQNVLATVDGALKGDPDTSLGRTLLHVEQAVSGVQTMAEDLPVSLDTAITDIMAQLNPLLANLQDLSGQLNDPEGTVGMILDADGDVYTNLVQALAGVAGTLQNLEKTSASLPNLMPEIALILVDLRAALKSAEDVLTSLTNNPLLKGGVPQRVNTGSGGTSPRDISF